MHFLRSEEILRINKVGFLFLVLVPVFNESKNSRVLDPSMCRCRLSSLPGGDSLEMGSIR